MKPRIIVAMPFYQWVPAEAKISVAKMLSANFGGLIGGFTHDTFPLLGQARDNMVRAILDGEPEATHVLFIDSDMVVPVDAPQRLLAHELPVVSALYHARSFPFNPVYRHEDGDPPHFPYGGPLSPVPLFQVDLVGAGCLLLDVGVFRKIPEPWFCMETKIGEDFNFCRKLRAAGIQIYVDRGCECGHVGTVEIDRLTACALYKIGREKAINRKDQQWPT